MNFKFAEKINPSLENFDFSKAFAIIETALKKIPTTEFHSVIGLSFTNQADKLAIWIDNFYQKASTKIDVKAMYFEMSEFDINTDTWGIHGISFEADGGLDINDMEWLCDFTDDLMTQKEFILTGFEKLQNVFENVELTNNHLQDARDWCEQLVIAKFMELMRAAHVIAKEKNLTWNETPIYFTEHSYDFILKSSNQHIN